MNAYFTQMGHFPNPDKGKLPASLLVPHNYVDDNYFQILSPDNAKFNSGKLPIDPYDDNQLGEMLKIDVSGEIVEVSGRPLNYLLMNDNYIVFSAGPDGKAEINYDNIPIGYTGAIYDATNGIISVGDIYLLGPVPNKDDK